MDQHPSTTTSSNALEKNPSYVKGNGTSKTPQTYSPLPPFPSVAISRNPYHSLPYPGEAQSRSSRQLQPHHQSFLQTTLPPVNNPRRRSQDPVPNPARPSSRNPQQLEATNSLVQKEHRLPGRSQTTETHIQIIEERLRLLTQTCDRLATEMNRLQGNFTAMLKALSYTSHPYSSATASPLIPALAMPAVAPSPHRLPPISSYLPTKKIKKKRRRTPPPLSQSSSVEAARKSRATKKVVEEDEEEEGGMFIDEEDSDETTPPSSRGTNQNGM